MFLLEETIAVIPGTVLRNNLDATYKYLLIIFQERCSSAYEECCYRLHSVSTTVHAV